MSTPDFIPGLELSRRFYREAVRPVLEQAAPGTTYSAALLGGGSEVLGFDTPRSRDHDWGPRVQIFLRPQDLDRQGRRLHRHLAECLPTDFLGYPTHFVSTGEPGGVGVLKKTEGPVHHRVEVTDPTTWFTSRLGFDPAQGITLADWLATPTQFFAEVTAGAVFHDGLGRLTPARERLRWYPHDLWLYVLACQWRRLSQEEAFVGRCGEVGDELGSAVITARLVRDLMRLCLLMHRCYPPYGKWLGSAFARTPRAGELTPHLAAALAATDWRTRERHLCHAYEGVAAAHNRLGLTGPVDTSTRPYHDRPFRVLGAERFTRALTSRISSPSVRALPVVGAIDHYIDSTDVLSHAPRARAAGLAALMDPESS